MADDVSTEYRLCVQCRCLFEVHLPEPGQKKKYCSTACRSTSKERRRGKAPLNRQIGECGVIGCHVAARTKGLCVRHYQHKRVHGVPQKPCRECGKATTSTYCGSRCRKLWTNNKYTEDQRSAGVKPRDQFNAERRAKAQIPCKICGALFVKSSGTNAGIYCSRTCSADGQRDLEAALSRQRLAEFKRYKALYQKWAIATKRRVEELAASYRRRLFASRLCDGCGKPVGYNGMGPPKRFCSNECRPRRKPDKSSETWKRSRRAYKAKRKALERGDGSETFDPFEIFERDGWRCHICGVKTPKRLRGKFVDCAPELDHIIPLAVGGKHKRINVACSCRKCNLTKGPRPLGQLRLVA